MTSPADAIAERQNAGPLLQLQAATRRKYTDAKQLRRLRIAVTASLLAAGPITYFVLDMSGDLVAAIAAGWLLVVRVLITPLELSWRAKAAYLADRYDTTVLALPSSRIVPAHLVSPEETSAAAGRYAAHATRRKPFGSGLDPADPYGKLRDWFTVPAGLSPLASALACQRGSAEYARRLALGWARICQTCAVAVCLSYAVVAILDDLKLSEYLIALAMPSVPSLLDMVDAAQTHTRTAAARRAAVDRADDALDSYKQGHEIPDGLCRELQDAAFLWRVDGPGAPDLWNALLRSRLDNDAAAASALLESDAAARPRPAEG